MATECTLQMYTHARMPQAEKHRVLQVSTRNLVFLSGCWTQNNYCVRSRCVAPDRNEATQKLEQQLLTLLLCYAPAARDER